jgi:hypothetical protein
MDNVLKDHSHPPVYLVTIPVPMSKKKPKHNPVVAQAKPPSFASANTPAQPPTAAPAAPPKNFYMRHDPFFTLLGTILIFITFIAKESVGEYFKESLTSIEKAEDMFVIRGKFADSLSDKRFIFLPKPGDDPTRQQAIDSVDLWLPQGDDLAIAGYVLAWQFSDPQSWHEKSDTITMNIENLGGQMAEWEDAHRSEKTAFQSDSKLRDLYSKSKKSHEDAFDFHKTAWAEAERIKHERAGYVWWANWISYTAFGIGTAITLYGQLSGKAPESPKPGA